MSTELLIQKICVALLLLSLIPGFIWGWRETSDEDTLGRLCLSILTSLLPSCILMCVGFLVVILFQAFQFVFT